MKHEHITCTTDPISGFNITDLILHPHLIEGNHDNDLTIYFENKATLQAYLDIPVEHPERDLTTTLSNPTDVYSG